MSGPRVQSYAMFIAADENAKTLVDEMPRGRAFLCAETPQLPKIFKDVFSISLLDRAKL
jgi:hypothetical protein